MDFGKTIHGLERSLDFFVRRQGLIAQNLAHVDTPGYRAQELDFGAALEAAFAGAPRTTAATAAPHPAHLPLGSPFEDGQVVTDPSSGPGRDGNNVDLDRETTRLSENQVRYEASLRAIDRRFGTWRDAMSEGGVK